MGTALIFKTLQIFESWLYIGREWWIKSRMGWGVRRKFWSKLNITYYQGLSLFNLNAIAFENFVEWTTMSLY